MYGKDNDNLIISGNTFPIREQMKEMRFLWDPKNKSWYCNYENIPFQFNFKK